MPSDEVKTLSGRTPPTSGTSSPPVPFSEPATRAWLKRDFIAATLGLVLCFILPLWQLTAFAAGSQLYSYILLVPFISFYLAWVKRHSLSVARQPARGLALGFLAAGTLLILAYWLQLRPHIKKMEDDYLAVMMIAFLLFFWGICSWFLGRKTLRINIFPVGFLIFLVPLPSAAVSGIDSFLQHGSAVFARLFFMVAGTPLLQDGLVFQLPGITLQIAPECSGIHSTLVLFITSLVASYLFLRTPWKRGVFVLAMIPLALLRNGFRVFTIGELCVHIGPHMIDSPIHHRGGPLFFALSLIPLFLLLIALYRSERAGGGSQTKTRNRLTPIPPK